MVLPNLIIAGPPKTGTTSLFDWLAKHPDVCGSIEKETAFFSDTISKGNINCNFHQHDLVSYARLFPFYKNEKIVIEATPDYIFSKTAISQIPNLESNPLVLFIHRNPSDRIVSEYKFHKYKTKRFNGSLNQFINQEQVRNKVDPYPFYTRWIEKTNNLKILLFDDLRDNPKKLILSLSGLLEIDGTYFESFDFEAKNESLALKNKRLHDLSYRISNKIPQALKQALAPIYFRFNSSKIPPLNADDMNTVSELRNRFEGDQHRLLFNFQKHILSIK